MRTAIELPLQMDGPGELPVFLRISRAVAEDIRRGRLKPGAALPGSRALAESLGVHRNTVLAAYRELEAEGWISTMPGKGTFVAADLPDRTRRPAARPAVTAALGFSLRPARVSQPAPPVIPSGVLAMGGGVPDVRLAPVGELIRAYRRAVRRQNARLLGYGDPAGHPRLREALARHLSRLRGIVAGPENILVTRGSQMALDLLARELLGPGDVVAVEAFGYGPAWQAFQLAGATLVPVPVDSSGVQVEAIERLAEQRPLRAVYVTPHHQYPTTAVLSPARRMALLELARRKRFAIIEDDYDHEFHFEGRPVLPLTSADAQGVVTYVGTLSKLFAPGLRIGFVVAPPVLVDRLTAARAFVDRQGDHAMEQAMAELIEDGELERHGRRACRAYRERRDVILDALPRLFGGALSANPPRGGMAMWVGVERGIDVEAWAGRAMERKVNFQPGSRFTFDRAKVPFLRLGYAAHDPAELREGLKRMATALSDVGGDAARVWPR